MTHAEFRDHVQQTCGVPSNGSLADGTHCVACWAVITLHNVIRLYPPDQWGNDFGYNNQEAWVVSDLSILFDEMVHYGFLERVEGRGVRGIKR